MLVIGLFQVIACAFAACFGREVGHRQRGQMRFVRYPLFHLCRPVSDAQPGAQVARIAPSFEPPDQILVAIG